MEDERLSVSPEFCCTSPRCRRLGGVGDFGPAAYGFVDFLAAAKQRLWQVLPLSPTGYGSSPYSALSAFAGNPLLISLEFLVRDGWLAEERIDSAPAVCPDTRAPATSARPSTRRFR